MENAAWVQGADGWAAAWGGALERACLQGALCALAVWALCRLWPRLPASARAWLWWLTCLKLTLGLLCLTPPSLPVLPRAASTAPVRVIPPAPQIAAGGMAQMPAAALPALAAGPAIPTPLPLPTRASIPRISPLLALGLVWLAGVLVVLATTIKSSISLRRRLGRLTQGASARIFETEAVSGPLVAGLLHPVILLPRNLLSAEERALALAHEAAHLRRGDLWLGLLPALTQTLFYFFPPARWAVREYHLAREEACDAEALRVTGADPAAYAKLLLRFATPTSPAPALGLGSGYQALRRRLTSLPHSADRWGRAGRRWASVGVILMLPLLLPWQLTAAVSRLRESHNPPLPDPRTLRFALTDLGVVRNDETDATGLNDRGQVVACIETVPRSVAGQAFLWNDGRASRLASLPGDAYCRANGINDAGQVIASSYSAYDHNQAFVWQAGRQTPLAGLIGFPHTKALGISENGLVAGYGQTGSYDEKREMVTHAAVWDTQGRPTDLGTLGGDYSAAYDVNDYGQVVGKADTSYFGNTHAFLWQAGRMTDLGTLGGTNSRAVRVNDRGQVIGYSETGDSTHAFVWQNGQMRDLGTLPGAADSEALGVNDRGQIVGVSSGKAVLWQDNQTVDLNRLIANHAGWTLQDATVINGRGQIAGAAVAPDGRMHAFLLTPTTAKK